MFFLSFHVEIPHPVFFAMQPIFSNTAHSKTDGLIKQTINMSTCTIPKYVYKLVPYDPASPIPLDPKALPDALPVSAIDQSSGFIHLSTATQLLGTLTHFFASDARVYVLRVPYSPLASQGLIQWDDPERAVCGERPSEGTFPHLYNGLRLGRAEVDGVWVLARGGEGWEGAVRAAEWLAC